MKKILILLIIFAVLGLGYWVYQDAEMKKKKEVNQVIHEAYQSLNIVDTHPYNFISSPDIEVIPVHPSAHFIAKSSEL